MNSARITEPLSPPAPSSRQGDEISVAELIAPLVRHRRTVVVTSLACAILAVVLIVILPRKYEAKATFIPEPSKGGGLSASLGSLAALAGALGVSPLTANTNSPELAAELLRSRQVLGAVLATEVPVPGSRDHESRPLLDVLVTDKEQAAKQMEEGLRRLRKSTSVTVDKQTGVVSLTVRSRYPALAAITANRLVAALDSFNIQRRQLQSRQERLFTEQRLAQARRELDDAEGAQLRFLNTNRSYTESPLLRFEANQLERKVQLKQELYVTLDKAYEQARIAEVQDTPLLTVIDEAIPPIRPASLGPLGALLIGVFLGAALGVTLAFIRDFHASSRRRTIPGNSRLTGEATSGPTHDGYSEGSI